MSKRAPAVYFTDIISAIAKIESYVSRMNFEQFSKDEKTQDAVVRNLEIIGEAARNISPEIKAAYSKVPWEKMISMRNKVLHEYFGVDMDILWKTIQEDLPLLKEQIKGLSETFKSSV